MGQLLSAPVQATFIQRPGSEHFKAGVATLQGWRTGHEDAHSCHCEWTDENTANFAVFDGHGGSRVAILAAQQLAEEQKSLTKPFQDEDIQKSFLSLDKKIEEELAGDPSGATCIAAIVEFRDNRYFAKIANLGDSRAVLIKGRGEEASVEGTIDHKPDDDGERARIYSAGGFVSSQIPARLDGVLSLSRAFGDFQYKQNAEKSAADQKMSPQPDIYTWEADQGDVLILACDGIFDVMSNDELSNTVQSRLKASDDVGNIASEVLAECLEKGSRDNMTIMIIVLENGQNHKRGDELLLGEFEGEKDARVRENYVSFAQNHGFDLHDTPIPLCTVCGRLFVTMSTCPCKAVVYCGRDCQRAHWKEHKLVCASHQEKLRASADSKKDGGGAGGAGGGGGGGAGVGAGGGQNKPAANQSEASNGKSPRNRKSPHGNKKKKGGKK